MATLSVEGIAIKGISCCVPSSIEKNTDIQNQSVEDIQKFIDATGVKERRIASQDVCTSDLCLKAAADLLASLQWEKESVKIIIFVSQTADYILPVTSAILQDRLGLSKDCIAFDVPLGCSGYVYGISIITGMMKAFGLQRGILLAGDTSSKLVSKNDKSTFPLFGDAASATAFEINSKSQAIQFDLGTDGSGYNAIIIPDGGSRNRLNAESILDIEIEPGISKNKCQLSLDGMDVFSFGISQAPKTVNKLLDTFAIDKEKVGYFIFHQANKMMNKMIVKKLKLPAEKVPYSLENFGNTSSATIPLTIVTELKDKIIGLDVNLILCGFGVGLSWGSVFINLNEIEYLNLIQYGK